MFIGLCALCAEAIGLGGLESCTRQDLAVLERHVQAIAFSAVLGGGGF